MNDAQYATVNATTPHTNADEPTSAPPRRTDCADCGGESTLTFEDTDDASGYRGVIHLCQACLERRCR